MQDERAMASPPPRERPPKAESASRALTQGHRHFDAWRLRRLPGSFEARLLEDWLHVHRHCAKTAARAALRRLPADAAFIDLLQSVRPSRRLAPPR